MVSHLYLRLPVFHFGKKLLMDANTWVPSFLFLKLTWILKSILVFLQTGRRSRKDRLPLASFLLTPPRTPCPRAHQSPWSPTPPHGCQRVSAGSFPACGHVFQMFRIQPVTLLRVVPSEIFFLSSLFWFFFLLLILSTQRDRNSVSGMSARPAG